jgi:hypothetical protein
MDCVSGKIPGPMAMFVGKLRFIVFPSKLRNPDKFTENLICVLIEVSSMIPASSKT